MYSWKINITPPEISQKPKRPFPTIFLGIHGSFRGCKSSTPSALALFADPNDLKSLVGLSDTRFIADLQMFFGGQGINVVTKAAAESWWIAPGTYKIDDTKQMNRRFATQSLRNLEWKYLHSLLFQTWRCLKPLYRFALLVWRCRPIVKPLSNHKAFRPAKSNPWLLKNLLKLQQHDMNRLEPNKKALLCSSSTNTSTLFLVPVHNWLFDK